MGNLPFNLHPTAKLKTNLTTQTTKRYPEVCMTEAYQGKGISSLKRSLLRISIASDAATNLCGPLGLRRLNLEALGPSCGFLMLPTGP